MNRIALVLAIVSAFLGAGCRPVPVKHYAIQAEVIAVDAPKKLLTIKHGEIPGLMPAMTMSYAVADEKQMEGLKPGDKISADLVVGENVGHLEKIVVLEKAGSAPPPADATQHTH